MRTGSGRRARTTALLTAALLAGGLLAACDSSSAGSSASSAPTTASSATSAPPQLPKQTLTFGVVGTTDEVDQYRQMAALFAPLNRQVTVQVQSWPDDAAMMAALRAGAKVPDVLLASRRDLSWLSQHQEVQPVDGFLDDRGFDFGDEYPRSALTAFSGDNRLECLPYGVAPSVIFYNKALVKLGRIRNDPPTPGEGWTLDQFAAAARWAVDHHPHVAGAYVDPSLSGIAPFLYSGGGQMFDDPTQPTSLAFSDETNQQSLDRTVRVLGRPGMSLTPAQLAERPAVDWFRHGKVAMMEGTRKIVPDLRTTLGFDFDVMPMPSLGTPATVAGLSGLCISQHARDASTAADFLVYASSPEALGEVASAGYLQPANQTVALSDAFQQPGRLPVHASVFTFSVKSLVYPPLLGQTDQLDAAVDPLIAELLRGRPSDVPDLSRKIDHASYRVLGPTFGPSGTASPDGSGQSGG
ncbi:MAG TPA: extracellular solute-binding protein [Nocardioides sp.]|nr:extracellular solute-binding protein [Nocardioides sp.]